MVLTPDFDHYYEDYGDAADTHKVLVLARQGDLPVGYQEVNFYRFRAPVAAAALRNWVLQANLQLAQAGVPGAVLGGGVPVFLALGGAAPGGGAGIAGVVPAAAAPVAAAVVVAVAAPAAVVPPVAARWRVAASEGALEIGEIVPDAFVLAGAGVKRIVMYQGLEAWSRWPSWTRKPGSTNGCLWMYGCSV